MSEGGEDAKPAVKITRLPEASKEDMIASEARHAALGGYKSAKHDPKDYPENFRKNVQKRAEEISEEVSPTSTSPHPYKEDTGGFPKVQKQYEGDSRDDKE